MASGKDHALASVVLSPAAALIAWQAGGDVGGATLAFVGCLSGLALSPDLDHAATTFGMEQAPIIGPLWQAAWTPYERAIPHRSLHSHLPGWGTLLRVAYLVALIMVWWLVAFAVSETYIGSGAWPPPSIEWLGWGGWAWWLAGLTVSDVGHATLDGSGLAAATGVAAVMWLALF